MAAQSGNVVAHPCQHKMLQVQNAFATFEFRRGEERQHFWVFIQEFRVAAQPGGNQLSGQALRLGLYLAKRF